MSFRFFSLLATSLVKLEYACHEIAVFPTEFLRFRFCATSLDWELRCRVLPDSSSPFVTFWFFCVSARMCSRRSVTLPTSIFILLPSSCKIPSFQQTLLRSSGRFSVQRWYSCACVSVLKFFEYSFSLYVFSIWLLVSSVLLKLLLTSCNVDGEAWTKCSVLSFFPTTFNLLLLYVWDMTQWRTAMLRSIGLFRFFNGLAFFLRLFFCFGNSFVVLFPFISFSAFEELLYFGSLELITVTRVSVFASGYLFTLALHMLNHKLDSYKRGVLQESSRVMFDSLCM